MGERTVCETCAALDDPDAERGYPGYCSHCHILWRYVVGEPSICDLCAGWWAVLAYLARPEPDPPHLLRKVAARFPEFEWLCFMSPTERAWYLDVGGDRGYIRQTFFAHVPDWAWTALAS
jgi:hypothetical protein